MFKKSVQLLFVLIGTSLLASCASYSITEQDMSQYLQDNVSFQQSVGIKNVMYAQVDVNDLQVKIGQVAEDRVSIFANTKAIIQMLSVPEMGLDLDIEFSAIPEYEPETGKIFVNSLRLEQFNELNDQLTPEIAQLLKPAVSMIGQALSQQPVYELDSNDVKQALLKSTNPSLLVKDNKLVIELFN